MSIYWLFANNRDNPLSEEVFRNENTVEQMSAKSRDQLRMLLTQRLIGDNRALSKVDKHCARMRHANPNMHRENCKRSNYCVELWKIIRGEDKTVANRNP